MSPTRLPAGLRPSPRTSTFHGTSRIAHPNTGWIYGRRDPANVTIGVLPQPDGSLRVQFDTKGMVPQDQGLDGLFTQAYNRRMGR